MLGIIITSFPLPSPLPPFSPCFIYHFHSPVHPSLNIHDSFFHAGGSLGHRSWLGGLVRLKLFIIDRVGARLLAHFGYAARPDRLAFRSSFAFLFLRLPACLPACPSFCLPTCVSAQSNTYAAMRNTGQEALHHCTGQTDRRTDGHLFKHWHHPHLDNLQSCPTVYQRQICRRLGQGGPR